MTTATSLHCHGNSRTVGKDHQWKVLRFLIFVCQFEIDVIEMPDNSLPVSKNFLWHMWDIRAQIQYS